VLKKLDETDLQVLSLLQTDGRMSISDISRKIDLSAPSTQDRLRQLQSAKIIKKFTAILDAEKLGLKLMSLTFVGLSLPQYKAIERFRNSVAEWSEVLECMDISGEYDFVLKIIVKDMRQYESLIREKLAKIPGVARIQTSFVLNAPKSTTEISLANL